MKAVLLAAALLMGATSAQAQFSSDQTAQFQRPGGPGGGGGGRGPGGPGGGRGGPDRGGDRGPDRGGDRDRGPGRGPDRDRGGRGGRGGGWPLPIPRGAVCTAQNRFGDRFDERGITREDAARRAVRTCEISSRGDRCRIIGCY